MKKSYRMKKAIRAAKRARVGCTEFDSLPPEWQGTLPPPPLIIREEVSHLGRATYPAWNPEWLKGLDKYIRARVQDELRQAIR